MGCLQVLLAIIFPPLAVLNKGCGSIAIVISLIPVIWFSLATYYKRVSALFYSNRVKAFIGFMIADATLDIVGLTSDNNVVYWICILLATGIFAYLVFSNSPIGNHDG